MKVSLQMTAVELLLEMLITALLRHSSVCSLIIKQDHQITHKQSSLTVTVTSSAQSSSQVSTDSRVSVARDEIDFTSERPDSSSAFVFAE